MAVVVVQVEPELLFLYQNFLLLRVNHSLTSLVKAAVADKMMTGQEFFFVELVVAAAVSLLCSQEMEVLIQSQVELYC